MGTLVDLVERDKEFSILKNAITDCLGGRNRPRLVIVSGPPASGKTKLLEACRTYAAAQGSLLLAATASRSGDRSPLSMMIRLFRSAGLPTGLRDDDDVDSKLSRKLRSDLIELGRVRPVLICVDNAQYSDTASLALLSSISRHPLPARILIVLAEGPDLQQPMTPCVAQSHNPHVQHISLDLLSPAGVAQMLGNAINAEPSQETVSAWHTVSGGNPLLVQALIDDWSGSREEDHGDMRKLTPVAGDGFRKAVMTIINNCGRYTRTVAEVLAVLRAFDSAECVRGLLDRAPETVLSCVRALENAGLLTEGRFRERAAEAAVLSAAAAKHTELDAVVAAHLVTEKVDRHRGSQPSPGDRKVPDRSTTDGGDFGKPLSRAERGVAMLVGMGYTNREISRELHITVSTVGQHLTRIYRKLGIRTRAELAATSVHLEDVLTGSS